MFVFSFLSLDDKMSLAAQTHKLDLTVQLTFAVTSFDVTEEKLRFDGHSFIADVGGFLGLLLGASAYSVYLNLAKGVKRALIWKSDK